VWEAEGWQRKVRAGGGQLSAGQLTPSAGLKQEDLGVTLQHPAAAQLLHQHLWLYLLPISPQQLSPWSPMSHQGHKCTAHRDPVGVQPLPELSQLLLECLEWGHSHLALAIPWPWLFPEGLRGLL
jgi:hypothetical protein